MSKIIGSIGLGTMGGSYAFHLLNEGYKVLGLDPDIKNSDKFSNHGGIKVNDINYLIKKSDVIILSLPTVPIFKSIINDIIKNYDGSNSKILIDMNTISFEDKLEAKILLDRLNINMIDAPVSGTGAQAKTKDLVVMSSGLEENINSCQDIFLSFAKQNIYVGEFGNGIKFKLLANLLVTVHNTVTAEALLLGQKIGLDENKIYEVLNAGAASSVMLDKRMPLMIKKDYEPATASMTIFLKDIEVIRQLIKHNNVISPTFEAAAKVYDDAKQNIPMTYDTAAIFEQLKINNK